MDGRTDRQTDMLTIVKYALCILSRCKTRGRRDVCRIQSLRCTQYACAHSFGVDNMFVLIRLGSTPWPRGLLVLASKSFGQHRYVHYCVQGVCS